MLALSKLEQLGWKRPSVFVYYKEGVPEKIRAMYEQNLDKLSEDSIDRFSNYYSAIYQQLIQNDRQYQGKLNPQKLIEKCVNYNFFQNFIKCESMLRMPLCKIQGNEC